MRLKPGENAPAFELSDLNGHLVRLQDFAGQRMLISFHRYAACPLCNLHIHELTQAWPELKSHGLAVVAIFMSGQERVYDQYESRSVPFPILADPERTAYDKYGVESSIAGMLASFVHPRAMKAFFSDLCPVALMPIQQLSPPTSCWTENIGSWRSVLVQYYSAYATRTDSSLCRRIRNRVMKDRMHAKTRACMLVSSGRSPHTTSVLPCVREEQLISY